MVVGREQLDPSASGGIAVAEAPVKVTGGVALTNTGDNRNSGTPRPEGVPDPGRGEFNLLEASIRSNKAFFEERLSGRKNKRCLHFRRQLTDLYTGVIAVYFWVPSTLSSTFFSKVAFLSLNILKSCYFELRKPFRNRFEFKYPANTPV